MKYFLCSFLGLLALSLVGCDDQNSAQKNDTQIVDQTNTKQFSPIAPSSLNNDQIFLFYSDGCPHCHDAEKYLSEKYADLPIVRVNIGYEEGFELFKQCAQKFNLGRMIGTPLFCMGENYIMGWGGGSDKKFDSYVQDFIHQ